MSDFETSLHRSPWTPICCTLFLAACSGEAGETGGEPETRLCDDNAVAGVQVDVDNAATDDACAVEVRIVEGSYAETLDCATEGADCHCRGAVEREGDYAVEVLHGSQPIFTARATVTRGECHVETVVLSVDFASPGLECTPLGQSCDEETFCPARFACQGMSTGSVCTPGNAGRETASGATCTADEACPTAYPHCLVYAGPGIGTCVTASERRCACERDEGRGTYECD
jgi:hypothetical protein